MQRLQLPSAGFAPALTLAMLLAAGGVRAQSGSPSPPDELIPAGDESQSLDSILKLVRDQSTLIEKQQKTIRSLEERLDKIESLALSSHNSGRMSPGLWNDKDDLTWAAYAGKGIGSYITDLRTLGGQDGVYDPLTNTVKALPVAATYVGYQHWWNDTMRSTATFGWVYVDNLDVQGDEALHQTVRYSINLSWSPIPRLDLVGEFLSGQRFNKNGEKGVASQFQFGTRFRF